MRVYIAQMLCPDRHCMMATAGEFTSQHDAEVMGPALQEFVDSMVEQKVLNPFCGICQSRTLRIEVRSTTFTSMAEAEPVLQRLATEQAVARMLATRRN